MTPTEALIHKHEGSINSMYIDSLGIPTIGVGHNLRDKPISAKAVTQIFIDDLADVRSQLEQESFFRRLNTVRQAVLLDVDFNVGYAGLLKFKHMLAAIEVGDFNVAAKELLDSSAARMLQTRYEELAYMLRTGQWL